MDTIELLQSLTNAFGVAGFEDEVREVIRGMIQPFVDEIRTDILGNLIATRSPAKAGYKLMLDAHMDEIGLMVSFVEENGFLRFTPIGGWDPRILPAHTVTVLTRKGEKRKGVIGSIPPHLTKPEDREKPFRIEDLFIDVGASSKEEAREMGIEIGDPAVPFYPFEVLNSPVSQSPKRGKNPPVSPFHKGGQCVMGKALDDRAGCAVLVKTLQELKPSDGRGVTLILNFATGEEIGGRGARTAAYQIEPDLAIALEGTIGADIPGIPPQKQPVGLGKGPAITIADQSLVVNRKLVNALETLAKRLKIPYQFKLPSFGGTDAGVIHTTKGGVLSGVISVPCRYIHSPMGILRLDDFENTVKLTKAVVQNSRTLIPNTL